MKNMTRSKGAEMQSIFNRKHEAVMKKETYDKTW